MKTYKVQVDTITFIVNCNHRNELFNILEKEDSNFYKKNNDIFYKFDEEYEEIVDIENVTHKKGIVCINSH